MPPSRTALARTAPSRSAPSRSTPARDHPHARAVCGDHHVARGDRTADRRGQPPTGSRPPRARAPRSAQRPRARPGAATAACPRAARGPPRLRPHPAAAAGSALPSLAQSRGPRHLADDRQPLGEVRDHRGVRIGQCAQQRAPDHRAERVHRTRHLLSRLGRGELAGPGDKLLELPTGPDPLTIGLGADRPYKRSADRRTVARQLRREDRRRARERLVLEDRHQPALGQVLGALDQLGDGRIRDRPCGAPAGWTRWHLQPCTSHRGRPGDQPPPLPATMSSMADELIPIDEARARVLAAVHELDSERVAVADALDRVLATELSAASDVPPFASLGDGRIRGRRRPGRADPDGRRRVARRRSERAPPRARRGDPDLDRRRGPAGATAVIRQEDVTPATARSRSAPKSGDGRPHPPRRRGDARRGDGPGARHEARPRRARGGDRRRRRRARGRRAVRVVRVLCTGDELREPGDRSGPGEIHNSNGPMLVALAARAGALTAPCRAAARRPRRHRGGTRGRARAPPTS